MLNCWEYKNCSRGCDGGCPAYDKKSGNICWLVAGTMCGGKVQGTYAQKLSSCTECEFYQYVNRMHSGDTVESENAAKLAASMRQKRILVVDDEKKFLFSAAISLKKAGYRTRAAESAEDALAILFNTKNPDKDFDLILLDVQMPGMNGIELIEELNRRNSRIPVFAISAHADKGQIAQLMRRGCCEYLDKPFEPNDLLARIGHVLKN
ncbi:MAG: response regulator [Nitrospirae bacterium]|nr:response regulator [Nitrospirota bacterium]